MIKLLVTILFKSSAAIKFIFISLLNETRFLFKGLSEMLGSGFDNLNYHLFQPIRLIRFQDVRDFLSDHIQSMIIVTFLIIIVVLLGYKRMDSNKMKGDNQNMDIFILIVVLGGLFFAIYMLAKSKNRNPIGWILLGIPTSPILMLIILLFMKKLPKQRGQVTTRKKRSIKKRR